MRKVRLNEFLESKKGMKNEIKIGSYLDFLKESTIYKITRTGDEYYWSDVCIALHKTGLVACFTIEQSGSLYRGDISPVHKAFFSNVICEELTRMSGGEFEEEEEGNSNIFAGLSLITGIFRRDEVKFTYEEFLKNHYFHDIEGDLKQATENEKIEDFFVTIEELKNQLINYLFDVDYEDFNYQVVKTRKYRYLEVSNRDFDIKFLYDEFNTLVSNEFKYELGTKIASEKLNRRYCELFCIIYTLNYSNFIRITNLSNYIDEIKKYKEKLYELRSYFNNKITISNNENNFNIKELRLKYKIKVLLLHLPSNILEKYKKEFIEYSKLEEYIPYGFKLSKG